MVAQPSAQRYTVTTSALAIAANTADVKDTYLARNIDASASVYLGGAAVTTSTGLELNAGESIGFTLLTGQSMYAISAGSVVVSVITRQAQ